MAAAWRDVGGRPMRGGDARTEALFSYVSCERRVPMDHSLRAIRKFVNAALAALSPEFEKLYARSGRPSIPPEKLTPSGEGPTVRIRFAPAASPLSQICCGGK